MAPAVYVQTNDAAANEVIAFSRADDGALAPLGRYSTGGRGTGVPHLASAGSVVLSDDGQWLVVVNAGSDELSLFEVQPDGLRLADRASSSGRGPTSVAVRSTLVYVLNNGTPSISGFTLAGGKLTELEGSTRPGSSDADPAQISFTADGRVLIVTERGTNTISSYLIDEHGYLQNPATIKSSGQTPYGFALTANGSLIVSEAFGGATGAAAASSYAVSGVGELTMVSGSVGDTRSEVCWVALTKDDRFAYVTNFGDGTVSSYEIAADRSLRLREAVAGVAAQGSKKGLRDEAISGDGRYLYAIDADAQKLCGWAVGQGGQLRLVGQFGGVPDTVAGLAAS